VKRGRPKGSGRCAKDDMTIIHAVLQVWNTRLDVRLRSSDSSRNVFAIAAKSLHRSESATRKAFDEAWARRMGNEYKPSMERRRVMMRLMLEMAGKPLPRRWRREPFVPSGDRDSDPETPRLVWIQE
jgi:hypothetical protein